MTEPAAIALRARAEAVLAETGGIDGDSVEVVPIGQRLWAIRQLRRELRDLLAAVVALQQPIVERYACQQCGRRDGLDAVLTDDEWERITGGKWNILCLWCMDELALAAGVSTGVSLYFAGRALHGVMEHAQAEAVDIAARSALKRAEAADAQRQAQATALKAIRAVASKAEDDHPELAHPTDIIDMIVELLATLTQPGAAQE